jgi:alkanesulfonate monooxygenase SsuD/methylene tetrahydromethanopterin reductase-like flavin-dependent oxidoreductase (luciferase family)
MKKFRDDVRAEALAAGRNPDDIKILFLASPIVDEFHDSAVLRLEASKQPKDWDVEYHLASLSRQSGIDFSQFDLDEPLPELTSNGHQSIVAAWVGRTPRSIIAGANIGAASDLLVGTPSEVADRMEEVMDHVGGDGFLIVNSYFSRHYVTEICDGLVPELQKRGLTRTAYEHEQFRDNLLAF